MARISGRRGALYVDLPGTGAATPVPNVRKYSFSATVDTIDVTAMGDTSKVYVADLPDAQGNYEAFYDSASPMLYSAASDGLPRKTYLYPDLSVPGTYFWGTATFDMTLDVAVDGAVTVNGSFKAASSFVRTGS